MPVLKGVLLKVRERPVHVLPGRCIVAVHLHRRRPCRAGCLTGLGVRTQVVGRVGVGELRVRCVLVRDRRQPDLERRLHTADRSVLGELVRLDAPLLVGILF